jgi:DNA-binding MarR family transcriptional regulator
LTPKSSLRERPPAGSDGPRLVIDQQSYLPIFFTSIANTWTRGASKVFISRFGVGALDWVVISMMAVEPGATALGICQNTSADKASVSRCLTQLEAKGLITGKATGRDPRKRVFELTADGYDLHDRLMTIAIERENQLLQGLTPGDVVALIELLRRVKHNLPTIQERDARAASANEPRGW